MADRTMQGRRAALEPVGDWSPWESRVKAKRG
jgi:hypothetical protein